MKDFLYVVLKVHKMTNKDKMKNNSIRNDTVFLCAFCDVRFLWVYVKTNEMH